MILFLVGGKIFDLFRHMGILARTVRRLDEAELVDAGVGAEGVDQTDVRTFRSLNRADTTVVGRMNITHFKAGAVTIQTARSESRETTLVGQFGQRIDLVHELAELATAEEVTHDGGERLRIDELGWSHGVHVHVEQGHALLDQTLRAGKTHAALVSEKLANGTHTTAAEMINIIEQAFTSAQAEEIMQRGNDVLGGEDTHFSVNLERELLIDLVATDTGEVIALRIEEQTLHESTSVWSRGRITRAQTAVDFLERLIFITGGIFTQGCDEKIVRGSGNDFGGLVTELDELAHDALSQRLVSTRNNQFAIKNVFEEDLGSKVLLRDALLELQVLDFIE